MSPIEIRIRFPEQNGTAELEVMAAPHLDTTELVRQALAGTPVTPGKLHLVRTPLRSILRGRLTQRHGEDLGPQHAGQVLEALRLTLGVKANRPVPPVPQHARLGAVIPGLPDEAWMAAGSRTPPHGALSVAPNVCGG
ncbi:hypothetical protein ACFL5O_03390 [Myxococcota bacterium]